MTANSATMSPTQLAANLGLREVDTKRVIDMIAVDTLLLMHRSTKSATLKKKIEKTWTEWNPGGTWEDDNEQVTSILAVGPPGHGKTTAYREACKKVAAALGMEFLEGDKLDATPVIDPEKHFVFVCQEAAGVVSGLEWLGLPTKEKMEGAEKETYAMGRLFSPQLMKAMAASGACILLDDFLNAQPGIQNIGLPLTETHSYNSLRLTHCYIGLTGNLGAQDGTTTNGISAALRNRTRMLFLQDRLPDFIQRATERYRDQIGDGAITSFLNRDEDSFTEWPDASKKGGYATPRSWDKFTVVWRRAIRQKGSMAAAMDELPIHAHSLLGPAVSSKLESYMNAYIKSADPIANSIIMEGKFDKEMIAARTKEALSGPGQAFFYQLGMALSDYAAKKVLLDKGDYVLAMERFRDGLLLMTDQTSMNMSVDNFKRVLALKAEHLSYATNNGNRELKPEVKQAFCDLLVKNPDCSPEIRSSLIRVMSNSAQFESSQARRQRRVGAPK